MNVDLVIWISLCKLTVAQINGEFWWLNNKLKTNSGWPSPRFEELSVFDTDESAKITFNDNELFLNKEYVYNGEKEKENDKLSFNINFQDESKIVWPSETNSKNSTEKNKVVEDTSQLPKISDDILEFKFPEDINFIWSINQTNSTKITSTTDKINNFSEKAIKKVPFNDTVAAVKNSKKWVSESICTYLKKFDCLRKEGLVHFRTLRNSNDILMDSLLVCCILPLTSKRDDASKIHFIDLPYKTNKRNKRSNKDETSEALKQRNVLLFKRYGAQFQRTTTVSPQKKATKNFLLSGNDYTDPYWNIKNKNFNKEHTIYSTEDYVEDYDVELPKPGLTGLYSDHKDSSWSFANGYVRPDYDAVVEDDDSNEESVAGYGGGFLDPRIEDRLKATTSKSIIFGRPAQLKTETASSEKLTYSAASHTINYQSNPDFNVLQGFKLLNLISNKSRGHKNKNKITSESVHNDSKESILIGSLENEYDESFEENEQLYEDCGKIAKGSAFQKDKKIGDTNRYSHPWLALVTLTKRRQTILCYATILHPRAAVTTADCVHRRAYPGEITLVAGAWDLEDEGGEEWQKRMVSVKIHSQYTPGELWNNLAVLYWKRPLRLGTTVQPACLADPHVGDDCVFVGWGGYDQDIRAHSRWQRVSMLTPRACSERISSNKRDLLPKDSFCAAVPSRATVTGVGGPLVCTISGKHTAVGVAIWRDQAIVLTPPGDWTLQTLAELQLR